MEYLTQTDDICKSIQKNIFLHQFVHPFILSHIKEYGRIPIGYPGCIFIKEEVGKYLGRVISEYDIVIKTLNEAIEKEREVKK